MCSEGRQAGGLSVLACLPMKQFSCNPARFVNVQGYPRSAPVQSVCKHQAVVPQDRVAPLLQAHLQGVEGRAGGGWCVWGWGGGGGGLVVVVVCVCVCVGWGGGEHMSQQRACRVASLYVLQTACMASCRALLLIDFHPDSARRPRLVQR